MRIFGTIFYGLGLLFFAFTTVVAFLSPDRFALHEVIESALFTALFAVWLWDHFAPIEPHYVFTVGAVVFTWAAVWPEYTLLTALFGAVAAVDIIAAVFTWRSVKAATSERAALDHLIDTLDQAGADTTSLRQQRNTLG